MQHLAAELQAERGVPVPVDVGHVPGHRHAELDHLAQLLLQLDQHRLGGVADRHPLGGQHAELEHAQAQPVPAAVGPVQQAARGQRGQHPAGRALGHPELAGDLGRPEFGMDGETIEHGSSYRD